MDAKPGAKFLIDGYPRAMDQATGFEELVGLAKMVLYFEADDETLMARLLERGKTSGRADDNEKATRKRHLPHPVHSCHQPLRASWPRSSRQQEATSIS